MDSFDIDLVSIHESQHVISTPEAIPKLPSSWSKSEKESIRSTTFLPFLRRYLDMQPTC